MSQLFDSIEKAYELFEQKEYDLCLKEGLKIKEMLCNNAETNEITEDELTEIKSRFFNFMGFTYLALNILTEAKDSFESALNVNPNSTQACAGMGEVFYLIERDEEAKVMFEWALDNYPANVFAETGLKKVNQRLGLPANHNTLNMETTLTRGDEFYKILTEAYKLFNEKKFEDSLARLGEIETVFNRSVSSKNAVTKIISLENFKGFNYLALDNLTEAKKSFERALNLNGTSSQACSGLAEIFFLQKKEQEAKSMYEWAVKNNPNNLFAVEGLKKVNLVLGLHSDDNSLMITK